MEQVLFNESRIPARITFLKPLSAAISIGTGGPFVAEGPIIATGGALGSFVGQVLRVSAGAAAGMSATFSAPVSAALLAIELLLFEYRARSLIPVALASTAACGAHIALTGSAPAFSMPAVAAPSGTALAVYVGMGIILDAAERLERLHELGRAVRAHVAAAAPGAPLGARLFVNLHSANLNDDELYSADAPLSKIARRVVLEVTERASLYGVKNVPTCVARLKALGFQIAIDDLGAGYAGLASFTQLEPEFAKLDMSLVCGIDTDSRRQSIVRSMKNMCDELGMLVIAEGAETAAERDMLTKLGCDLLQGYLFARPERGFMAPRW